jgi:cysteine desulfurase/selenocysteine lyase
MDVNTIREDFPTLRVENPLTYLDNACVTLRPDSVIEAVSRYYSEGPGCGGRSPHRWGSAVTQMVMRTRRAVADFIGAERDEVVFTHNATAAINQVAYGLDWQKGDVILTTDREHNSNLVPWLQLERRLGVDHRCVASHSDNTFDLEAFEAACAKAGASLRLVAVAQLGNLDGVSVPVPEICKIAHDHGAMVLVDGAQSVPHSPTDVSTLDCDYLAFSLHKMLGPSGMGVLWGREESLANLETISGGGQTVSMASETTLDFVPGPARLEGGLGHYAGIAGTGAAIEYLNRIDLAELQEHEVALNRIITDGVAGISGVDLIGPADAAARAGITALTVEGCDVHDLAIVLDEAGGVMVRSGFHCVNGWFQARNLMAGSLRTSVYLYNTEEECRHFTDIFSDAVNALS